MIYIKKDTKVLVNKIFHLLRPYKWKIIIVSVFIMLSSVLSILTPLVNKQLIDAGLIGKNFKIVVEYSIYNLILLAIIQGLGIMQTKYRSYIQNLLSFNLEKQAFKHTLKLKMSFFSNTNYAEIINNLRIDISNIAQISNENTFYILTSILRIIVGIIGLLMIDWKLSILVIFLTPIRYLVVKYLAKKRKVLIEKYIESYKDYSKWYGDTIGGIKEIKLLGLQTLKTGQFIKKQRNIIKQNIKAEYIEKANVISGKVFTEIIESSIYIMGGYMIIGNSLTVGKLFAFITYSAYITQPIFAIMNIGYTFSRILPSAKRYFDFMDTEIEEYNNKDKLTKVNSNSIAGTIEFKNVNFSYENKDIILNNINFKINSGETIAIIGNNGSGKTTIINLILKILTPNSGTILLDGVNINSLKIRSYRQAISVVSQDVYLFNTTIKENIMLNSMKSDNEMYLAVEKSGAHKFIKEFPNQYETIVGDRGSKLSGGQRQKTAMARAFLRDSKILILDEATANYDMEAEYYVNNVINQSYKDKTIIIITHKPDILAKVDKILLVNDGQVEAIGNHLELYENNKLYREMIRLPLVTNI